MNTTPNSDSNDASPSNTDRPLAERRCVACEGLTAPMEASQARDLAGTLTDWVFNENASAISRKINCKTFAKAVTRINQIAEIAETEQHHPDLHLTGYRHLEIVLTTHAIGGLSENDFIVAAKIDELLK
ncbi:MAG: 4a-hydroxytetrahydrobiopterin dehydratase [Rhodopirellula sp. JB044]|uniref:4a-hydroxytetrahydrobiopterin dehydratase n=1 Tax=Rhodopirellula sp. JB044 TaxID=3342844 RepID=UPI00370A26E6